MAATAQPLDPGILERAFNRLAVHERTVLTLRFSDGLSESQIAAVLGCRTVAVRRMIGRALRSLHRDVVRETESPSTAPTWRAIAAHVPSLPPR